MEWLYFQLHADNGTRAKITRSTIRPILPGDMQKLQAMLGDQQSNSVRLCDPPRSNVSLEDLASYAAKLRRRLTKSSPALRLLTNQN